MPLLFIFCEGRTEQNFAEKVIKEHLAPLNVYAYSIRLTCAKKKGIKYLGGGHNYLPKRNDILDKLKEHQRQRDVYVTTMIDLYALGKGFPGFDEAERFRASPYDRVAFLEHQFALDIGDDRFIPHYQLHEFEALLFCEPSLFELVYGPGCKPQIDALNAVRSLFNNPELIDDGPDTAPSKRIIQQFHGYERDKAIVGPELAEVVRIDEARKQMPHFHQWITRLETLSP